MPEEKQVTPTENKRLVSEKEGSLSLLLQKVIGDSAPVTEKQIDEMLAQRREVYGYVHADRQQESWDKKFFFIGAIIAALLVIGAVMAFAREYMTEVISIIIGGFGGYGIGKSQRS